MPLLQGLWTCSMLQFLPRLSPLYSGVCTTLLHINDAAPWAGPSLIQHWWSHWWLHCWFVGHQAVLLPTQQYLYTIIAGPGTYMAMKAIFRKLFKFLSSTRSHKCIQLCTLVDSLLSTYKCVWLFIPWDTMYWIWVLSGILFLHTIIMLARDKADICLILRTSYCAIYLQLDHQFHNS